MNYDATEISLKRLFLLVRIFKERLTILREKEIISKPVQMGFQWQLANKTYNFQFLFYKMIIMDAQKFSSITNKP